MDAVKGFFGGYRYLSNFHVADVTYQGLTYPSTENAYQAAKTLDHEKRKEFMSPCTPKEAKQKGKRIKLRSDWEQVKLDIMEELVRQKFTIHEEIREKLIATGDAYLEETNTWNDKFWGVCDHDGRNHLGKILMRVRTELQELCQSNT